MRILALDTASSAQSAALIDGDHVVACVGLGGGRAGSERVLALAEQVLDLGQSTLGSMGAVAVSRGPGSLTGLRVGIGTARGLALGAGLPLVGVSTLRAIAAGCGAGPPVLSLVDAGRGEVYGALFTPGRPPVARGAERVGPPELFARAIAGQDVRIVGSGAVRYRDCFIGAHSLPSGEEEFLAVGVGHLASALIDLAGGTLASNGRADLDPSPRYLTREALSIVFEA